MAFTKIVGAGIHTLSNVHTHNINSSGIITATNFVGIFSGTDGDFSGNVTIDGNLVVNGDTTTLNTTLREVEILRVDANNSTVGAAITQSGSGDILNLYDGSTKVFSATDGGAILMGGTSSRDVGFAHKLQLEDTGNTPRAISIISNRANQHASHLDFAKSRGGSLGSNTIVQDDDFLGHIIFRGADGTDLGSGAAKITGAVDGTPASNNIPGRLEFYTSTGGTSYERLRIDSSGRVLIGTTTEGFAEADDLTIYNADHGGITIRTPTNKEGNIAFSDTTSGTGEYSGLIRYRHSNNDLGLWTNSLLRLLIDSSGRVMIGSSVVGRSGAQNLTIGSGSGDQGMTIRSGTSHEGNIYFSDGSSGGNEESRGIFRFDHSDDSFQFYTASGNNFSQHRLRITSDGNIGVNVTDPKSKLHLPVNEDVRVGGQYGGTAQVQNEITYSSGYTGVHWMFESNQSVSWCFDGAMIVNGSGSSTYGSEIVKITIVYSREYGALNSGDTHRNGSSSYNIETLGHDQVGLNPSAGSISVTEETNPDGAGSTRSLFKLSWSASGQSVGVVSRLVGNFHWGAPSGSGSVEIQDKDGNIYWNSNP